MHVYKVERNLLRKEKANCPSFGMGSIASGLVMCMGIK